LSIKHNNKIALRVILQIKTPCFGSWFCFHRQVKRLNISEWVL